MFWPAIIVATFIGAPEPPLQGHALALTANPNEATLRYQWRNALRGMAGARLPVVESADTPWVFVFSPSLEISNGPTSGAPVPFEYWRGRATLELGHRIDLVDRPDRLSLQFSLLVTHESAHETAKPDPIIFFAGQTVAASFQLHTNDAGLRVSLVGTMGSSLLAASLTQRLHFSSCTVRTKACDDVRFSFGLESELDFMIEGFALDPDLWLRPYGALSAMFIPQIDDMGREGRVVVEAGATLDPGKLGRFRLFFSFLAGHEPGFLRERLVVHAGVGIGFGFF